MQVITSDGCVRCADTPFVKQPAACATRHDIFRPNYSLVAAKYRIAYDARYHYDILVNAMRLERLDSHENSLFCSLWRKHILDGLLFILQCLFYRWPNSSQSRTTFPLEKTTSKKQRRKRNSRVDYAMIFGIRSPPIIRSHDNVAQSTNEKSMMSPSEKPKETDVTAFITYDSLVYLFYYLLLQYFCN